MTADEDRWIITDKRSGHLTLRFRVKGFEKQFFMGTGLEDTLQNRVIVRLRRDAIATDILLERFDPTLESYRLKASRNNPTPVFKAKYEYDLAELWYKFTDFKKNLLEQTTILMRYQRIEKYYISKLPTLSLGEAPKIRDWLLKNTTHQMAWDILIMVSHCCDWAVDSGLIPQNPFIKLKIKKPKKKSDEEEFRAFTLKQRDLIIEAFEQHRIHAHYAPLVKFLFWTGCRPGEAFALTWGDVQDNCTRILINKSCNLYRIKKGTKNGKRRVFPTRDGSRLQEMLLDLRPNPENYNPKDLIFRSKTGKSMNSDLLHNCWYGTSNHKNGKIYRYPGVVQELAAHGRVPYLKPYATRHTFATWAISTGVSPDKVARWIGDEVTTVLSFYCHPNVVDSECPDF